MGLKPRPSLLAVPARLRRICAGAVLVPSPVRIQSEADRAAAPFALLSFEDPVGAAGAGFPFFAEAPRLLDGRLILKIERWCNAARVRIPAAGPFPDDAALMVRLGYGLALAGARRTAQGAPGARPRTGPSARAGRSPAVGRPGKRRQRARMVARAAPRR